MRRHWAEDAACIGTDPNLFDHDLHGSAGLEVCTGCPVMTQCRRDNPTGVSIVVGGRAFNGRGIVVTEIADRRVIATSAAVVSRIALDAACRVCAAELVRPGWPCGPRQAIHAARGLCRVCYIATRSEGHLDDHPRLTKTRPA